jgi:hypothetical protein
MAAGSTYTPIATTTLGSTATSYTFSSIPSTYTDLVLVASIKYTTSGDYTKLTFNGDTSANYSSTVLIGNGSSASSSRTTSAAFVATSYDANNETFTDIFNIQNYANASTFKTVLNRHSVAGTRAEALVGLWGATPQAITSVTLTANTGYASTTSFTLYGIAAA